MVAETRKRRAALAQGAAPARKQRKLPVRAKDLDDKGAAPRRIITFDDDSNADGPAPPAPAAAPAPAPEDEADEESDDDAAPEAVSTTAAAAEVKRAAQAAQRVARECVCRARRAHDAPC